MNITHESYGHAVLLHLNGELSEDTVGAVGQAVDHQIEADEVIDVVFDLQRVPFIDSVGLEFLQDLQDRLAERFGQVKLLQPEDNVLTILEITRLRSCFEVYDDISEAVKAIHA